MASLMEVGGAGGHDHQHAHDEDPDEELDLHGGLLHREDDEGDERHAGDAVGLEAVGAGAHRVARVVAGAVGDDAGVAGVVFLDVEDDLHQVGADVGDLGEDAARDPEGGGAQRLADGEADEAGARVVAGNEEEDAEHEKELDRDQQHPDAHARLERDGVDGIRLALQAGEGGPRVREGVDADAEPGHPVGARDADEAEQQDDDDLAGLEVQERPEVEHDDGADEDFQEQDELALGDEIRLAGLVDQLGDLEHGLVHGQVLQLGVDDEAEEQAEDADAQAALQQRPAAHAQELGLREVRDLDIGLAAAVGRRGGGAAGAGVCAKAASGAREATSRASRASETAAQTALPVNARKCSMCDVSLCG